MGLSNSSPFFKLSMSSVIEISSCCMFIETFIFSNHSFWWILGTLGRGGEEYVIGETPVGCTYGQFSIAKPILPFFRAVGGNLHGDGENMNNSTQ